LARLLAEILDSAVRKPVLRVDNKSTISLIRNPVHHDQSKHIDTRFHLIREYAHNGQIEVDFIRTDEQLGDVLTKPLCKISFKSSAPRSVFIDVSSPNAQDLGGDLLNNSCARLAIAVIF